MPVLTNKYNQMIEYFNKIKDELIKSEVNIGKLRQLQRQISQDEDIYFITQDVVTKIIYYIIEVAYDENELQYEKFEYLAQVLKDSTEIIRSSSLNKKAELLRLRTKCQIDNDSPFYDSLMHITTTTVTEVIKLLFNTTRAGLHPHWISSDEGEEDDQTKDQEEGSQAEEEEENNLYLPD